MDIRFLFAAVGFLLHINETYCDSNSPEVYKLQKFHGPIECDDKKLAFTDDMSKVKRACWNKYFGKQRKSSDLDKNANITCKIRCDYKGFNLIVDNKFVKEKIAGFVQQVFPKTVHTTLTAEFTTCADKHGSDLEIKVHDGKCLSNEALFKCTGAAIRKICKTEAPGRKR